MSLLNNKLTKTLTSLIVLSATTFIPLDEIWGQNLSPIESVEFGGQSPEENAQSELTTEESIEEIESELNDDLETAESVDSTTQTVDSDAVQLIEQLNAEERRSGDYVVLKQSDNFLLNSYSYLKDGDLYLITRHNYGNVPLSFLVEYDSTGAVNKIYMSVEALYDYAEIALETYPDTYKGTIVEELLDYSKSHSELADKYLEIDLNQEELSNLAAEIYAYDHYFLTIAQDLFSNETVDQLKTENDKGVDVSLDEETAPIFKELTENNKTNYPALDYILDLYPHGFLGEVSLDYQASELSYALLSDIDQSQTNALEAYIRYSSQELNSAGDEEFISWSDFNDNFASDLLTGIIELEKSFTVDDFPVAVAESTESTDSGQTEESQTLE